jgi:hypothetical protein
MLLVHQKTILLMKGLWVVLLLSAASKAAADCFDNPAQANCTSYQMNSTTIQNGLNSLCSQMPYMPVSIVWNKEQWNFAFTIYFNLTFIYLTFNQPRHLVVLRFLYAFSLSSSKRAVPFVAYAQMSLALHLIHGAMVFLSWPTFAKWICR